MEWRSRTNCTDSLPLQHNKEAVRSSILDVSYDLDVVARNARVIVESLAHQVFALADNETIIDEAMAVGGLDFPLPQLLLSDF